MSGDSKANNAVLVLKDAFSEWGKDNASLLAAGIAYYSLFSLSPLVIVLIAVAGFLLGSQSMESEVLGRIGEFVGPAVLEVVRGALKSISDPKNSIVATVFASAFLIGGAAGLFLQVKRALNMIWGVKSEPGGTVIKTIRSYISSFFLILLAGCLILVSGLLTTFLSSVGKEIKPYLPMDIHLLFYANIVLFFIVATALLAATYKTLSGVKLCWKDVFYGSALTSLLFAGGNLLMKLYVDTIAVGSIYGAAATLVVALFWIYYSAQIFLYGAEVIKVYARTRGSHCTRT